MNIWKLTLVGNPILIGDCAQTLKQLPDESIDLIVCDPPYGHRFMGLDWDRALPSLEALKECCRVLKSGAFAFIMCTPRQDCLGEMIHLLGRTGFETGFSSIYWCYGTGFPKISNVSKIIDKRAGTEREVISEQKSKSGLKRMHPDSVVGIEHSHTWSSQAEPVYHTAPATPEPSNLTDHIPCAVLNRLPKSLLW